MGTVRNVNNVSFEDVFSRSLRLNGERRNRLSNVRDVSSGRGRSIRPLRCAHCYRLVCARLRSLLPIISIFACFSYQQSRRFRSSSSLCYTANA